MNSAVKSIVAAVVISMFLSGCTDSGAAPTTEIIFVIVNGTDSRQSVAFGAYEPGADGALHGQFVHGMGSSVSARDARVDHGRALTEGLSDWVWHVTHGQELVFDPAGCTGVWIVEARIVEEEVGTRLTGESRCEPSS